MHTIDILISIVLGLIMFGIGSSLRFKNFTTMFREKKPFMNGLTLQMVFLPLFAILIATFSDLSPELKVGFFIVSICPGGTTSNFISYIVNADVALSIALTCINSILILITIPLLTDFAIENFIGKNTIAGISIIHTFFQVLFILLIPAILGVVFNETLHPVSKKIQKPLKFINTILLGLVFGIKFFADSGAGGSGISQTDIINLLPYCLLLHFGSMIFSYIMSRKLSINKIKSTTIGIEVGLQNTALALLVTGTLIGNNEMTKPALVFAIFSFFTTLFFASFTMKVGRG